MIDFFTNNYEWIFSGVGIAIIGWVFFSKKQNIGQYGGSHNNVNTNNININNSIENSNRKVNGAENESANKGKESCKILFIDDQHSDFKMVSILKKAGWINTRGIQDLTDLDSHRAKEASIIFVDINGVGSQIYEDQGLGLAAALKEKYPDKTIILYSADPTGDRFNKNLKKVDDSLPKNAEPYEFIRLIEQYS